MTCAGSATGARCYSGPANAIWTGCGDGCPRRRAPLLEHAQARMPAVSPATEPLSGRPVDPTRAVAGWTPAERKWLAEFVAAVRARHAKVVQDVIVYGSKARGDWNDDSDIDVLVIVADGAAERRKALRHLAYDLSLTAEALPAI